MDKTIIYYVGGADADQNKANAADVAAKYYPDAKVKPLDPAIRDGNLVDKGVQVVIVLGVNDAPV